MASIAPEDRYGSTKLLWHLVTEQALWVSSDVLAAELRLHHNLVWQGLTYYQSPSQESRQRFLQKRPGGATASKLTQFILKLSHLLQVEEGQSKLLLSAYLAGEFRGTKQSLRTLIEDERLQSPLLLDIWQFYRAERLYLLQVLKQVISHARDPQHPHQETFQSFLQDLEKEGDQKNMIFRQMRSVMKEPVPNRESHGTHFSPQCVNSWLHSNLREQAQLLQITLLYLHWNEEAKNQETFTEVYELFSEHGFGRRQLAAHLLKECNSALCDSVAFLETLIMCYLIDLSNSTVDSACMWMDHKSVEAIDKMVASLGSVAEHGPVMLSWMLAHFMMDGPESIRKYHGLGERAVNLGTLKYLEKVVKNEVISADKEVLGIAKGICYAILSVMLSAFEPQRMGIANEAQSLIECILRQETIAEDFWTQGLDVGCGIHFSTLLDGFPSTLRPLCELGISLSSASTSSAELVLKVISQMTSFAEPIDLVPSSQVSRTAIDKWKLLAPRHPSESMKTNFCIPASTEGSIEGSSYRWHVQYNGWEYLQAEVNLLSNQIAMGVSGIKQETLINVTAITALFDSILKGSERALANMGRPVSSLLLMLIERCVQMVDPPLQLLTNCLRCLSTLADDKPRYVWSTLAEKRILPNYSGSSQQIGSQFSDEINSNVIGSLLARQESVNGEFPLTTSFLTLLLKCCRVSFENHECRPLNASIMYIVGDVFPSFRQWRFAKESEREKLGQQILLLFREILENKCATEETKHYLCHALIQRGPLGSLFQIINTGDRQIQTLVEAQSSWECGVGIELASMVNEAMIVFRHILQRLDMKDLEGIGRVLSSPSNGSNPHFLLTLLHYLYHIQSLDLPISALKLMAVIAKEFPMSLLACLGKESDAVKDILIYRLESPTEDATMKQAIIDVFTACIDAQPGFIQLVIGIQDVNVVNSQQTLTAQDKAANNAVKLIGERGCMKSILALLEDTKQIKDIKNVNLQKSIMNFFLGLWHYHRIVAMAHLKRDKSFWKNVTWPLFQPEIKDSLHTSSQVFRIISSEIFTFSGKVDPELLAILEKFCDPKEACMENWATFILNSVESSTTTSMTTDQDVTVIDDGNKVGHTELSLLGAWKTFLIVLAKDQPVNLSPKQCALLASKLLASIRNLIDGRNQRAVTSISELCLILLQRWQTKCTDNMTTWCKNQALLLDEFLLNFDDLNLRTKAAVLGIVNTALKYSHFKLNRDECVLHSWLEPVANIVIRCFAMRDEQSNSQNSGNLPVLAVNLLRNLMHRIEDSQVWLEVLHRTVIVQTILTKAHHCLRQMKEPAVIQAILNALLVIGSTEKGCRSLLACDLSELLWLPLSNVKLANKDWIPVFNISLHLIMTILKLGKYEALDVSFTFAALFQEQLTSFLLAPKVSVQVDHLELTVSAASFIDKLMHYNQKWLLQHPSSLVHFYHVMSTLLHVCACLLLRPSLLSLLISRNQTNVAESGQVDRDIERVRRMSSTDHEVEMSNAPETTCVQNFLLDAINAVLGMLRSLSPDITELVTGNIADIGAYEQLLQIGFSSPTFEQENGLTYGTLVSVTNVCLRSITRGDRSPSPAPPPPNTSSSPTFRASSMDKRRLLLVLEQALLVLMSQALLCFAKSEHSSRDNQLLKRELGSEFSSCIETMRRYVHRGTKSPQLSASPGAGVIPTTASQRLVKSDEQYMKVISAIVQTAFK